MAEAVPSEAMSQPAAAGDAVKPRGLIVRRRWWILASLLVVLSPAIYSWTRMATLPSSLPLGVRTVEWLRMHHFNVSLAASELGLSRGALYRRMEKHGL